jgi:hypothetical protein
VITRYEIEAHETSYSARIVEIPDENGEWVKYEDVKPLVEIMAKLERLFDEIKRSEI